MTAIKVVWALRCQEDLSREALTKWAVTDGGPAILAMHPSVSAESLCVVGSTPARSDLVSSWWSAPDAGAPGLAPEAAGQGWSELSAGLVVRADGWRVDEVVHWDELPSPTPGEATPGVQMIAFVARRPDLSPEEFERRYRAHAAIARVHHPGIARYVQNFVRGPVNADAPAIDAIAELSFASREDYAARFYRDESSRGVVAEDVARFMERGGSWSVLAVEHRRER